MSKGLTFQLITHSHWWNDLSSKIKDIEDQEEGQYNQTSHCDPEPNRVFISVNHGRVVVIVT
jgi:hypothetical protein